MTFPRRRTAPLLGAVSAMCIGFFGGSVQAQIGVGDDAASKDPVVLAARDLELGDLSRMSLEELMSVSVTSVAGVEHQWFTSPAALYVITNEEVRRSGHQTIAEALRLAPGVYVGQSGSNRWQVGTRGFNGGLANKTLVLIDGRQVYDPLFGGTLWDVQDVLLEDLDRIEVIRGPGPTLWGANAVNGVFNIVTRSAKYTQGFYGTALLGTWEQGMGAMRYGAAIDDDTWFRVYGKYANFDNYDMATGRNNADDWDMFRGGFRIDHEGPDGGYYTIDGAGYGGRVGEFINAPQRGQSLVFRPLEFDGRAAGAHLLARIGQEDRQAQSGWWVQGYYDRTERVIWGGLDVERDTFNLEFRHHFRPVEWQEIVAGLQLHHTMDRTEMGPQHELIPADEELTTISGFIQDTFTIIPQQLFFMIGTKLEHNEYTGFEFQPSGRVWWTPDEQNTLWASISRAVRIPSRLEHGSITAFAYVDAGLFGGTPGEIIPFGVTGNDDLEAEILMAYETGYRRKIAENLTADVSLFFNDYDRLIFLPPPVLGSFTSGSGESYGGEVSVSWKPADNWRLQASYSYVDVQVQGLFPQEEGNTPHHMAQLRSYYNITEDIEFNVALYYVDTLGAHENEAYIRLDVGFTWHVSDQLEIAVWGQNLLEPSHSEFTDQLHSEATRAEVPRAFYIQATVRF